MAFYSCNRYRLVVLILLILIIWQAFHLMPVKKDPSLSESNLIQPNDIKDSLEDAKEIKSDSESIIIRLEDDKYNKHKKDKVKVRIYYEVLCPDSRSFFLRHLEPVVDKLAEFLDVTLVPYGKATTHEENGKYFFNCQHGETECYGNKIHACSIDYLANMTMSVKFTSCMIADNNDPDAALKRCGTKLSVETEEIRECASSDMGSEFLKKYGDDTHIVNPTFIPTIIFPGSKENNKAALKNFLLEVCKKIDMPLPPPCL